MLHDSESLRDAFQQLPPIDSDSIWDAKRSELRDKIETQDPAHCLTWPTIVSTMFVGNAPYIENELAALPASYVIPDPGFGAPELHPSGSSGNLIHQAYHLYQWERVTGQSVRDLRSIIEVGGGYGAMALVALHLGFRGSYQIIDLPEFAMLQQYYLSNTLPDLHPIIWTDQPDACDLLIACHSLSEIPISERDRVLEQTVAGSYLFVYHCEHNHVDNLGYFAEFARGKPGYRWEDWGTAHLPNQRYRIGYDAR